MKTEKEEKELCKKIILAEYAKLILDVKKDVNLVEREDFVRSASALLYHRQAKLARQALHIWADWATLCWRQQQREEAAAAKNG